MKSLIKQLLREGLTGKLNYEIEHLNHHHGQDDYELGLYLNGEITTFDFKNDDIFIEGKIISDNRIDSLVLSSVAFGTYNNGLFTGIRQDGKNGIDLMFQHRPTYKIYDDDKFITRCYWDYNLDQYRLFIKKNENILEKKRLRYFGKRIKTEKMYKNIVIGIAILLPLMSLMLLILNILDNKK